MNTPSFIEDHISQIPALKLLMNMGWKYLSPDEALEARGGRSSNVLLEDILKDQLEKINKIDYKQKEFKFSESNINNAILAIRDLPAYSGDMHPVLVSLLFVLYDKITFFYVNYLLLN